MSNEMINEDGDYVGEYVVGNTSAKATSEVFFRAAGGSNSPAAAKYSIPPAKKTKSPAAGATNPPAAAESIPPAAGAPAAGEDAPQPLQKKHIIKSKPHAPAAAELGDPLLDKLLLLYAKELDSSIPGVTKVCNYQGLQGLASSYHSLPQPLRDICKLPDRLRTPAQSNALAAYGYQVLMGKV